MIKDLVYILIILAIVLAQVSFLNPAFFGVNLVLAALVALVLTRDFKISILIAWLAGLFMDVNKITPFGLSALVLISVLFSVTLIRRFFLSLRRLRNIAALGLAAAILARLTTFIFLNLEAYFKNGAYEKIGFYFWNWGFLLELAVFPLMVIILFKLLFNAQTETIKFSNRT